MPYIRRIFNFVIPEIFRKKETFPKETFMHYSNLISVMGVLWIHYKLEH